MATITIIIASVIASLAAAAAIFAVSYFIWDKLRKRKASAEGGDPPVGKIKTNSPREWLVAHKPTKRRIIQVYAALLYNANIKGYISGEIYTSATTKYMCVPGLNCYSCPAAVGACPLGAFQNALAESNTRFPYYVLGILALFGLTLARTICGFLCPVGLAQELLYKIRSPKLKKSKVTRALSYFKYVLLFGLVIILPLMYAHRNLPLPAFCKYVCPAGTVGGAVGLLINPNNSQMFSMLGAQFAWKFSLAVAFIVGSVFIFRFFCRFFCPLGAIYGFFNRISLIGVKVDQRACINCGKCISVCPMDTKRVGDHECINCGKCISACPTKAIAWKGPQLCFCKTAAEEVLPSDAQSDAVSDEIVAKPLVDKLAVTPAVDGTATLNSTAIPVAATQADDKTAVRKKRDKRFWLELTAWILAVLLLVGALVYYNFIDVDNSSVNVNPPNDNPPDVTVPDVGYRVGELAPDFTVKLYKTSGGSTSLSDDAFTLYQHRGKFTVINFWATWCTPCVNEIPHFDKLAANYPDINVIAVHGDSTTDVGQFIDKRWQNSVLTFAQDNLDGKTCLTYRMLGGKGMWPLTLILDENGVVLYNSTNSFDSYSALETLVKQYLPKQ